MRERVLGPEHPDTLVTRGNLARWTGEAGDPAAARDLFAALLPVHERVLGPEHPDTLVTRANLAFWTGEAGDPAAARDQFAALLPVRRAGPRRGAPGHPDRPRAARPLDRGGRGPGRGPGPVRRAAARARAGPWPGAPGHPDRPADLADWTGQAGDPAAARDQFAALLPVHERVLGAEHPDTLPVRGNLARWTGEAGDPAAARDQFAALLPVLERVLGAEHPIPWPSALTSPTGPRGRSEIMARHEVAAAYLLRHGGPVLRSRHRRICQR